MYPLELLSCLWSDLILLLTSSNHSLRRNQRASVSAQFKGNDISWLCELYQLWLGRDCSPDSMTSTELMFDEECMAKKKRKWWKTRTFGQKMSYTRTTICLRTGERFGHESWKQDSVEDEERRSKRKERERGRHNESDKRGGDRERSRVQERRIDRLKIMSIQLGKKKAGWCTAKITDGRIDKTSSTTPESNLPRCSLLQIIFY